MSNTEKIDDFWIRFNGIRSKWRVGSIKKKEAASATKKIIKDIKSLMSEVKEEQESRYLESTLYWCEKFLSDELGKKNKIKK